MKIDVLSIGSFPAATNAELAKRFAITHHFNQPAPDALSAELKARIRGIATEANRGADRALIEALPRARSDLASSASAPTLSTSPPRASATSR